MSTGRQLSLLDGAPARSHFGRTLKALRSEGVRVGEQLQRAREELAAKRLASPAEVRRLELLVRSLEADRRALDQEARNFLERRA